MNPEDPILPPVEPDEEVDADLEVDAEDGEELEELEALEPVPVPVAEAVTGELPKQAAPARKSAAPRPDLTDRREPLYRECKGYRLRLDPPDLARLRELAGSRGKSDDELGEAFFDGQAERLAASIADDVPAPSEIRVVVDPYSRQAFLALENRIRGILSF